MMCPLQNQGASPYAGEQKQGYGGKWTYHGHNYNPSQRNFHLGWEYYFGLFMRHTAAAATIP
jgi:hypothetical protein